MTTSPNDTPFEIESKFEVASQQELNGMEALFRNLSTDIQRERRYETIIRYYDTQDGALNAAQVVLRTMDECLPYFKSELDVKTKGFTNADGVLIREEYEFYLKDNNLDLSVVDHPHAQELLKPAAGKKLSEAFNTVTRRQDICIVFNEAGKKIAIELALDDISFVANDNKKTVLRRAFESEVEFKRIFSDDNVTQKEASALIKKVKDLLSTVATMSPIAESRAETGFRLIAERKRQPKPRAPKPR